MLILRNGKFVIWKLKSSRLLYKGKCEADLPYRLTWANPSKKQKYFSPLCLWSQAQRDKVRDNSQSLGYKIDNTSSIYLYAKLNWDATRFLPAESKDCMNCASYDYSNMSARSGAQCVPIGMPIKRWEISRRPRTCCQETRTSLRCLLQCISSLNQSVPSQNRFGCFLLSLLGENVACIKYINKCPCVPLIHYGFYHRSNECYPLVTPLLFDKVTHVCMSFIDLRQWRKNILLNVWSYDWPMYAANQYKATVLCYFPKNVLKFLFLFLLSMLTLISTAFCNNFILCSFFFVMAVMTDMNSDSTFFVIQVSTI